MSAVLAEWADKKKEELASWWAHRALWRWKTKDKGRSVLPRFDPWAATKSATNNPVLSVLEYDKGFRPG